MRASLALAFAALALLAAPVASAHADLDQAASQPPPNGHVAVGTTMVTLVFTEDVVRDQYTNADVKDLSQRSVASGPVLFDDARHNVIRVPVRPLADGIYGVEWKTLSSDTHTLHGGYFFSVGNATLKIPTQARSTSDTGAATTQDAAARFVFYAGLFVALGVPVFLLVIDRRASKPARAVALAGVAALVGGVGAAASLYLLAVRTDAWIVDTAFSDAGQYVAARGALLGLAGATLLLAGATKRPRARAAWLVLAIALAALATIATSLASHAAADREYPEVSVTLDALHLAMGGLWIGGVVAFALTQWGKSSREVAEVVTRFTPLALTSVALVLATGTWASFRHVPRVSDLWNTLYGLFILAKLALLAVLVFIGFVNKEILGPRLRSGLATPATFRRVLQVEAFTMALVLVAAGGLASTSPPTSGGASPSAQQTLPRYLELQGQTGEYHLVVQIAPNPPQVGPTQIIVALHPFSAPLPSSTSVQLQFQDPGTSAPRDVVETPVSSGPNEWTLNGFAWTEPGAWKMIVLVQTKTFNKFTLNVTVEPRSAAASG